MKLWEIISGASYVDCYHHNEVSAHNARRRLFASLRTTIRHHKMVHNIKFQNSPFTLSEHWRRKTLQKSLHMMYHPRQQRIYVVLIVVIRVMLQAIISIFHTTLAVSTTNHNQF